MLRAGAGPPLEGSVRALRLACLLPLRPPASLPRFLPSFHVCLLPSSHASPPSLLPSFLPSFLPRMLLRLPCLLPRSLLLRLPCLLPRMLLRLPLRLPASLPAWVLRATPLTTLAQIHSIHPMPAGAVHTQTFNQHHPPPAPASTVHPQTVRSAPPHFACGYN